MDAVDIRILRAMGPLAYGLVAGGVDAVRPARLEAIGYTNVAHLDGGFKAWAAAGKPVAPVEEA